jgi:linoleoyl-CoA desaturase
MTTLLLPHAPEHDTTGDPGPLWTPGDGRLTEEDVDILASAAGVTDLPQIGRLGRIDPAESSTYPAGLDLDALAEELDAIRDTTLASLGQADADYIRKVIRLQRGLDLAGRAALLAGVFPPAWLAGVAMLSGAKILENMEVGHNVMHGQWDWMCDPEIHSTTWEWDHTCPSSQWKHSHNYLHHRWTNVAGKDRDIGYGAIRIDPDSEWYPRHLAQPAVFVGLALAFDLGISLHDNEAINARNPLKTDLDEAKPKLEESWKKIRSQGAKDFFFFPLLASPLGLPSVIAAASGALAANVIRNLWTFGVIFCGHFPDDVRIFTEEEVNDETPGGWYYRQIVGSANFTGGPLTHLMTGNLDHQIEHHLFPDLPSNRYAEIAPQVEDICERHGIDYNTGSFAKQFGTVVRKVLRFSLPSRKQD